ncbi:excisionase family DNA binding protein [Aequitasia blattaphilus]|uniref:Helix-turn-helix domain-containing protein n=1 Tax=Aequitasia blattaphilus TaxID=2949332 RepID=A0ABT1EBS2_9FIRM|nr:helix-turn-helix domain-containing protein [Aequitasia blattaphilus]MCP1101962.1 helix-turn-helix domain-containing protein [Aequitasia blattaphilus]MCR8614602.1 helix-turn-helix domain-containing protein [Aequitasia blattaphilus]
MAYLEERIDKLEKLVIQQAAEIEGLKSQNMEQLLLTPEEFSKVAKINLNTVYTWIREGRIKKAEALGRAIRIPMSQFSDSSPEEIKYKRERCETKNKKDDLKENFRLRA